MSEADQAFIEEVDAVFKKHGKMLVPHLETVLQIRPLPPTPTAPTTTAPAPTTDESMTLAAPAAEAIPSPIQRSDLSSGNGNGLATA